LPLRTACADFKRIWQCISRGNEAADDRLLLVIETKTESLRDFPGIGTPRDDIRPGLRTLMHDAHLIA